MLLCTSSFIIMINDHCKNHIDVVFPYTHIHTVLVHNQICKLLYNADTHSDTTDTRLISAHVLRTELQVSMGSATGGGGWSGGRPPPDFKGKFFNIICPPDFGGFWSEIYNSIIKFVELREWESIVIKILNFRKFFQFLLKFS